MSNEKDSGSIVKLGQFIKTQKGFAFKSKWFSNNGTPIVKVTNFTMDSVDLSEIFYIPDEIAKNYNKFILHNKDIVIQTVGSWPKNPKSVVGKVIRIPYYIDGASAKSPTHHSSAKYPFYIQCCFY